MSEDTPTESSYKVAKSLIILLVILIPTVSAFEIASVNYSADSYHYGSSGEEASSVSIVSRSTTTYQQGSSLAESSTYELNVGHFEDYDSTGPILIYLQPLNGSVWNVAPPVVFNFNVTDWDNIDYCDLYLDGLKLMNRTSIQQGLNNFTRNLGNGQYNYSITCYDDTGNNNSYDVLYFTVAYIGPTGGGGGFGYNEFPEEEPDILDEFFSRKSRPQFEVSDLKLVAFLILVWAGWYIFLYRKEREEVYVK